MRKTIQQPWFFLSLLIVVGVFLRFTNLFWGEPFWFHPDERNIASAVTRLQWPDKMNPEFFAYGTVPIYINFFIIKAVHVFLNTTEDPFSIAIKIGRIISAIFSTFLIFLMYWIGNKYFNFDKNSHYKFLSEPKQTLKQGQDGQSQIFSPGLIAAILTTFTFGFIQFAHFGTFEIWLTVLRLLLLVTVIEIARKQSWRWIIASGIIFGLAVGTKITSLILFPGLILALFWSGKIKQKHKKNYFFLLTQKLLKAIVLTFVSTFVFFITNPYVLNQNLPQHFIIKKITDLKIFLNPTFIHAINSEGGIARGDILVFYTRHFTDTIPYIYQFQKIYPYVLSWSILVFGSIGILGMGIFFFIKNKKQKHCRISIAYLFTALWFFLQLGFIGSLYVKWTRYTIPTLPYLILGFSVVASITLNLTKEKTQQSGRSRSFHFLVATGIFFSLLWHIFQGLFFTTIYLQPDPRVVANQWAIKNLSPNTKILSEVYDIGIVPFNYNFMQNIALFNFYELDNKNIRFKKQQELKQQLSQSNTIVLLSRRIWKHSIDFPQYYPESSNFYNQLFSGKLGFIKTAEFYNQPSFGPFKINDEIKAEETFSVFDHPHLQIWQRN